MKRLGTRVLRVLFAMSMVSWSVNGFSQGHVIDESDRQAALRLANYLCSSCHGPEGRSEYPLYPSLAAQNRGYLDAQLKAFRSRTRADQEAHDYMWGISAMLNDNIITVLPCPVTVCDKFP